MNGANHWISEETRQILKAKPFPPGTVVFPKVGAAVGTNKKRMLTVPSIVDNNVMGVAVKASDVLDPWFLLFWFEAIDLVSFSSPGTVPSITTGAIEKASLMLPPIGEQSAIVRALKAVQETTQARRRELALERERKAALLGHLFTHGTRGEATKETEIGEIPASWAPAMLGEVTHSFRYGTSQHCTEKPEGYPVLRIPNVVGGRVDVTDLKYAPLDAKEADRLRLERGDLLFVRTNGQRHLIGRCAVYEDELEEALYASYLIRARLDLTRAVPRFIEGYVNSARGRVEIEGRASNAADGKFNVNQQTLGGLSIPLPPLDEQREIADVLAACDSKVAALEREIALHDELFSALLEELMTGRRSALPALSTA